MNMEPKLIAQMFENSLMDDYIMNVYSEKLLTHMYV